MQGSHFHGVARNGLVASPSWYWTVHGIRRCLCEVVKAVDLGFLVYSFSWSPEQHQNVIYTHNALATRSLCGNDWYWRRINVQGIEGQ